jgi:hypothetical protein
MVWNSNAFRGKSEDRKQGILVGVMMLNLLGRRGIRAGHEVFKVMKAVKEGKLFDLLDNECSRFNELVADESLRLPNDMQHPARKIIVELLTEASSLSDVKRLAEEAWSESEATAWETIKVGAYYEPKVKQMIFPCEIFKTDCVNSQGEVIRGSGVRSDTIAIPTGGMVASYGGRDTCNDFQNKLKKLGLETHVILSQQKILSFDGRSEGNGVFDHFFYAQMGTVSFNCNYTR